MNATEQPIRGMYCPCCGARTQGRQWHNQDTGFGLCPKCAEWIPHHRPFDCDPITPEEFERTYGVKGVHFSIIEEN